MPIKLLNVDSDLLTLDSCASCIKTEIYSIGILRKNTNLASVKDQILSKIASIEIEVDTTKKIIKHLRKYIEEENKK